MKNERNESLPEQQENDTLAEKADIALAYLMKYQKQLIAAVALIILVAGGLIYLQQQNHVDEQKASELLGYASSRMDNGFYAVAIEGDSTFTGLKEISSRYRSTFSGQVAVLMLGDCYLALEQTTEALEHYRSYKGNNRDLQAASLAGEALCLDRQQLTEEAAAALERASATAHNPALQAIYLSDAAGLYIKAGQGKKAGDMLTKASQEYSNYAGGTKARQMLQQLSATTPVKP
ncbi:MAG: hypothetical protein C1942_04725 [Prosthecochloris sp.]|uniref:hypothetical protein n=1 Tax=Prosthecochloris sp. TaxID=290513 RepID=UPI0013C6F2B8|nr:hypothetical protein [Prosthecochloris sp.]NEX11991.1 hypothetical protein [Prosthecochloris sp.]